MEVLNIDTSRSYATRDNLIKALNGIPEEWRYVVVCNTQGRFTAIFLGSTMSPNIAAMAAQGFMTVS